MNFLEVFTASIIRAMIALMMKAVSTPETSVSFCDTAARSIPKHSHLHTRRRINMKSHIPHFNPDDRDSMLL
jgi:hypothetical protein